MDVESNPGLAQSDSINYRSTNNMNTAKISSNQSNIKIAHLNICSLKNKEHYLLAQDLVLKQKFDIFTISETWLDTSVTDIEIEFPGYAPFRLDRNGKRARGVSAYVNQSFKCEPMKDLTYISKSGLHQLWLKICYELQMVDNLTRVTEHSRTLIDVILTSSENNIKQTKVIPNSISDHDIVMSILALKKCRAKPVYVSVRSFKHYNKDSFCEDISNASWSVINNFEDVYDCLNAFDLLFNEILDQHAPNRKEIRKNTKDTGNMWKVIRTCIPKKFTGKKCFSSNDKSMANNFNQSPTSVGSNTVMKIKSLAKENNYTPSQREIPSSTYQLYSEKLPVVSGVPQGSILGQLLFSIYVNDLPSVTKNCSSESYIDDTKLPLSFRIKDSNIALTDLNEDLIRLRNWCFDNLLLLNPDKTKLMVYGSCQILTKLPDFRLSLLGRELTPASSVKDLGVKFDPILSFDNHILSTVSSCKSSLCQINRAKHVFRKNILITVINALVFSKLHYCSLLWSNTSCSNLSRLQGVQNFAAWVVSNRRKFDHITPILKELRWFPVKSHLYSRDALPCLLIVPVQNER
ncbi:Hypothetical predicted protein [Paramuricea clavata]|uniref:Reverse transcriptase domain-containing protein n=1 Tax=Paramuricea clavata TaxID=317549 RepID=A0A6S7G6U3_PARCT|nr:Hypothetical predicted protein [Paramuricea clavata]